MKYGWRWITPTQSRIGTGYVFSSNHVSVDEATDEFLNDIGDMTIEPFLVDFVPKYNKKPFKKNSCTVGMSCGFLEPLDAPGLDLTIRAIGLLSDLLDFKKDSSNIIKFNNFLGIANSTIHLDYEWWTSFILHQYKTCWRNDNEFWIDHKNVKCNFYDQIISLLYYAPDDKFEKHEFMMFYLTTAAKDIQWRSKVKEKPFEIKQLDTQTIHHLDYIQNFYD